MGLNMRRDSQAGKPTIILSNKRSVSLQRTALWQGDAESFLDALPHEPLFDLVVTSPPYNIGKQYEEKQDLDSYLVWQERIIRKIVGRMKETGSLCWQVGNRNVSRELECRVNRRHSRTNNRCGHCRITLGTPSSRFGRSRTFRAHMVLRRS